MENTKKKLSYAQKNYLVCAVLMIIVGILMLYMKKTALGIGIIIFGVVFFIGFFVLLAKDGMMEVPVEEKASDKKKSSKEEMFIEPEKSEDNENDEQPNQQDSVEAVEKADEEETNQSDEETDIEQQSAKNTSVEEKKTEGEKE